MTNDLNAPFLTPDELADLGLGEVGRDVRIHRTAVLVNCGAIRLGCHVRIDPFVLISAGEGISFGRNVHVASHASLVGRAQITLEDFVGVSQGARILSASDDFSGRHLTNPTVPEAYTHVRRSSVTLARHVLLGAGAVVLPGCALGQGAAVGALSLVTQNLEPWTIYAGAPARAIATRDKGLLSLESAYLQAEHVEGRRP